MCDVNASSNLERASSNASREENVQYVQPTTTSQALHCIIKAVRIVVDTGIPLNRTNLFTPIMITPDAKIVDLLKECKDGETPVSLEYFPPRTEDGVKVCTKYV